MEKLCDDITSGILIRLPSKDISQLRCVCKRWNTLSREANFIKSHRNRSINNNDKDEILLVFNRGSRFHIKAISSASPDIELINFIKFPVNFPHKEAQIHSTVIGFANGLICFSVGYYADRVVHVWNPSLSALLTVPPYAIPVPYNSPNAQVYFGFGFDPKNDDYKIVKVIQVEHKQSVEWLQVVYSMRSGCWKLITQRFPSCVKHVHRDTQVRVDGHDGHLHWLCGSNDDLKIQTIVAFDLAAESFSEISLPDPINNDVDGWFDLGVFGGKLCAISCARGVGDYCVVWVMDQYGSWVNNGFLHFHKDGVYHPYGFTLKNNFIYYDFCNGVVHLYDPAAPFNKVKPFQKIVAYSVSEITIIPYVESLVWVTPPTC